MEMNCAFCGGIFVTDNSTRKYCGRLCYSKVPRSLESRLKQSASTKGVPKSEVTRAKISASTKGTPKPWQQGAKNVNFNGSKMTGDVRQRISESRRLVGSAWTPAHCEAHRQRMLGDSNAMRGSHHTPETVAKLSEIKKRQYREGKVNVRLVQRLRHHEARGVEHNIARYFDFDYMGSSEFEFGAIPKAKKALNAALPVPVTPEPVKLTEGQHTAWYIGPEAHLEMAKTWFREELAADHTGMKERSNLRELYTAPTKHSYDGWFCVDGGWREGRPVWAMFAKKDAAMDFVKGLRGL